MHIFTSKIILPAKTYSFLPSIEHYLLLDIETTGILPSKSKIYLLGLGKFHYISNEEIQLTLTQYFLETFSDEMEILKILHAKTENIRGFITYNGYSFDLRFLQDCANAYHIDLPLFHCENIDILQSAKKLKHVLGLSHVKQRDVEHALGFYRKGKYEKQELIDFYHRYLNKKDEQILDLLLKHHAEELQSLIHLLALPSLENFFSNDFTYIGMQYNNQSIAFTFQSPYTVLCELDLKWNDTKFGESTPRIDLKSQETMQWDTLSTKKMPKQVAITSQEALPQDALDFHEILKQDTSGLKETPQLGVSMHIKGCTLTLHLPTLHETLKYFLPNYKDYDFIISENQIMHKSLSAYISKSNKRKAAKDETFLSKTSVFIPVPDSLSLKCYKREYSDQPLFVELADVLAQPNTCLLILNRLLQEMRMKAKM